MRTADLYVEVQRFYAHQMPLLEARRIPEFVDTFTADGSYEQVKDGWRLEGRDVLLQVLTANAPVYGTSVIRHWFDQMRLEPLDAGSVRVTYRALVSVTAETGAVTFEPSTTVTDVLVRQDGGLRTKSRSVRPDTRV